MKDIYADFREIVVLAGGFRCRLTTEELNEWEEFTSSHPAFYELSLARHFEARARAGHEAVGGSEFCVQRLLEAERKMYAVARAWYATIVEKRGEEASQ